MNKEAFRSAVGALRHAKRVVQTSPVLKGGLVGGAIGGGLGGYGEKKKLDRHMESAKFKKLTPEKQKKFKSKNFGKILKSGLRGAVALGVTGASLMTDKSFDRQAFKSDRRSEGKWRATKRKWKAEDAEREAKWQETRKKWKDDDKKWQEDFKNKYGPRSSGSSREARSAKVNDVGTPDWLKGVKTKAEAKTKFREQAKTHHPDRGGSEEKMKDVNSQWDSFQKHHFHKLGFVLSPFFEELKEIYSE